MLSMSAMRMRRMVLRHMLTCERRRGSRKLFTTTVSIFR